MSRYQNKVMREEKSFYLCLYLFKLQMTNIFISRNVIVIKQKVEICIYSQI
jgi:NADH:ubiquinone oxidoreductase subunit K